MNEWHTYKISLMVNSEGFWLAKSDETNEYGEVEDTPAKAVETFLKKMGVETDAVALVLPA